MEPLYKKYAQVAYDADGEPTKFELSCPENFNFAYDVLDVLAAKQPDAPALVWCDDNGRENIFSYAELSRLSVQAANCLAQYGIHKGSRVLLMMKRHYSYWYTILGLHRLGAVAIPATFMLTEHDLAYRIKVAEVDAIVCVGEKDLCGRVEKVFPEGRRFCVDADQPGFIRLESALEGQPDTMERVETHRNDTMLLYFTSGTTGDPKAVLHNFVYPLYHIPTALFWQQVVPGGLHLSVADTGWGKASWGKLYGQWLCGSAVMVYDCRNVFVNDLLGVVKKYGVTTFCAPPTLYRSMVKGGFDPACFATVRRCTTAGEDLKLSIAESFTGQTGLEIFSGYGQTETALVAGNISSPNCETLGRPMPLYDLLLVDEDGDPVGQGEQGEIVLRVKDPVLSGTCVCYLNGEGQRVSAYDEKELFHTGDIASFNEEGRLMFAGRTDDMIKSSGFRISPQEIEAVLIRHPAIADCAVTGVPDGQRGTLIKAFVVLKEGVEPTGLLKAEILRFALEHLAHYKTPREVTFCTGLPKTFSGKLRRGALEKESKKME